jgi:pilus assembly protein CpaE
MTEKIKVMIVDDNETTRDGTLRLLDYEDNIEIVGFAENGAIAIERVLELQPHVVLMDINMPVMNGIDATKRLQEEAPRTQVIVVSVQDDAHYLKEAFRAGAVDFVAKPITSAELTQAIQRAYDKIPDEQQLAQPPTTAPERMIGVPGYEPYMPSRLGNVVSVVGLKGGVGKTFVAVNLAIGLAYAGKKVVLVDSNLLFGDVSLFLNTRSQYNIIDLARMAVDPDQLDPEAGDRVLVQHESGLRLLIAPGGPAESEAISQATMSNLLDYLKQEYEYVIVDTATSFDDVLAAAIQSADRLVVVTAPNMPALKDTRILFNELVALEYPMDNVLVALNWMDRNTRITRDQIANFLKHPVEIVIPTDLAVVDFVNQGLPMISQDARRLLSVRPLMGMVQLVRDVFETAAQQVPDQTDDTQARRGGLFGGLRG